MDVCPKKANKLWKQTAENVRQTSQLETTYHLFNTDSVSFNNSGVQPNPAASTIHTTMMDILSFTLLKGEMKTFLPAVLTRWIVQGLS